MATFAERLNEALSIRNVTAAELSRITGISEGSISQYRRGTFEAAQRNLDLIATALNISIPWLMGLVDDFGTRYNYGFEPIPRTRQIPVVGSIACGDPILAIQTSGEATAAPDFVRCDFALRCKGDSMINARIFDGDMVYIRKQEAVDDGDIAAVLIEDEATLKRVRLFSDHIILEPANPMYKPLVFWDAEMQSVKIMGKAVAFTSNIA